jgi:glycosyltransferase involved in cell wall biosynthesis
MLMSEPTQRYLEAELPALRHGMQQAQNVFVFQGTPQFLLTPGVGASTPLRLQHSFRRLAHWTKPRAAFYRPTVETARSFAELLERERYDFVAARYLRTASASGALNRSHLPVIVDLDDLDDAVLANRLASSATSSYVKPLLRLQLGQTRAVMQDLVRRCQHVFVSSPQDQAALGPVHSSVLPNIPFRQEEDSASCSPPQAIALFVGTYLHRANREGVRRFVERSWPAIRKAVPEARFRVVGSGGWEADRAVLEANEGVEVVGQVDRLGAEYGGARVCVSPIEDGAGTQIKVLEALLFARPILVAKHGARGYETLIGHGLKPSHDACALEQSCIESLLDPEPGLRAAQSGQAIVNRDYSQSSVDRIVYEAVMRVLSPSDASR